MANFAQYLKRNRKSIFSWLGVIFGTLIMAAGYVLFTNPYQIIPGGVYGLGRVFHSIVPTIPTGTFGLLMDIPLMITGFLVFGKGFGAKTLFSALLMPFAMNAMTAWVGENPADVTTILGAHLNLSDNVLVAVIFGGVLIGAGGGFIIKSGATSGGTDIVSMLGVKYFKVRFSQAMFVVESVIILTGMLILQDWKLPLYSLITIFVTAKALDLVLDGASYDKLLFIITDKKEAMRQFIISEMERGGTYIHSKGMYTDREKEMIFLVVSRKEVSSVQHKIKEIDPLSFVVVVDAHETFGDGFKSFPEKTF